MTNTIIPQTSGNNATFSCPDNILIHHWQEWLDSCVNPTIIAKNVSSILDSRKLDELLNRNSNKRYKHSDDMVPAWVATGVDPLSGERWLSGIQAKPDVSPIRNGKPQKYFSASGYGVSPVFLEVEDTDYWSKILNDTSLPIIITEGVKKAGCLLSIGYASISIPGVSTCRKNGRLNDLLKAYCTYGRTVYLGFDNDVMSKRAVQLSLLNLSRDIAANGSKIMIINIPPGDCKGIDDYIAKHGEESFDELVKTAKTIEEWKHELDTRWSLEQGQIENSCRSKLAGHFKILEKIWGDNLRFNELKNQIELNGEPINLEGVRLEISLNFDFDMGIADAIAVVERIAKLNSYHPVHDYLTECERAYPSPNMELLENIAERYFGTSDKLHNIYLKKTLLAAVARIMEPGCQHDAVTVLVGRKHGTGKSSFWRELFSRPWFSDQLGEASKAEDDISKIHQFWGLEISELESIYKKKETAALKKFISAGWDVYRAPYARSSKEHPRRSILVGTTNEEEVLTDPTGNRRFWMVPTKGMVPLQKLIAERDELWAAAYALYKSGARWELSEEEKELQLRANEEFRQLDPWESILERYCSTKDTIKSDDLYDVLKIEINQQNSGISRRIAVIMKNLGWEQDRVRCGKYRERVWVKAKGEVIQDTLLNNFENSKVNESIWDIWDIRDKNKNHVENPKSESDLNNTPESSGTHLGHIWDKPEPSQDNGYSVFSQNGENLSGTHLGQGETLDIYTFQKSKEENNCTVPDKNQKSNQLNISNPVAQDTRLSTQDGKTVSDKETITTSTLPTIKSLHQSPLGEVKVVATPGHDGYEIELEIPGIETVTTSTSHTEQKKVLIAAKKVLIKNLKSIEFQIHIITAPPGQYEWVDAQFIDHKPNEYDHKKDKWVFLRNGFEYSIQDLELIRLKPNA